MNLIPLSETVVRLEMMNCKTMGWALAWAVGLGLVGCTYDDLETLGTPLDCDTFETTYGLDILPLVTETIAKGVIRGSTPSAGIAFESHAEIAQFAEIMVDRMDLPEGDPLLMPQSGKLDSCSIARFHAWIEAGKPNN